MKIDWKYVATTPSYRAIKDRYCTYVMRHPSDKKRAYSAFTAIIRVAKTEAVRANKGIVEVLDYILEHHNMSILNMANHFKLSDKSKPKDKPITLSKYFCTTKYNYSSEHVRKRIKESREERARHLRKLSGKKARWSTERKARERRYRQL